MTDREAAAGLVESMPGVCDALDRMGMHILAGFCEDIGPTITTILSGLERAETSATNAEAARNMLAAKRDAAEARALKAEKERDEAHARRQEWTRKAYRAVTAKSFAEKRAMKAEALVAEAVRIAERYVERFCKYTDGKVCGAIEDALCPGCAAFEFIEKAKS